MQPQCRFYTFENTGESGFQRFTSSYHGYNDVNRFPYPDKRICVLTDASYRFFAGLVTQLDEKQLDLPMEEQDLQPLALLSGEFKGAQLKMDSTRERRFRYCRHSDQG
jgi:hypothetical protein